MKINNFNQPIVPPNSADSQQQTTSAPKPSSKVQNLQFSDSEVDVIEPGASNPADSLTTQQVGFSANDSVEPVDPNSDSALRTELAGALGVPENDPSVLGAVTLAKMKLNTSQPIATTQTNDPVQTSEPVQADAPPTAEEIQRRQQIIQSAIQYGTRTEQTMKLDDNSDITQFTEFVPGTSGQFGDVYLRTGETQTQHGFFGDTTTQTTTYHDQNGQQIGVVKSVIDGGKETITKVVEFVPGSIALQVGDTRFVPDSPLTTPAGKAPSTWDPQTDGSYGRTGGVSGDTSTGFTSSTSVSPGGDPGNTSDVFTAHGQDSGGSGKQTDPVTLGEETTASDPSEWAVYPGTSGDSSSPVGIVGDDVRDDGSVQVILSDGTTHDFANASDAMDWEKQQGLVAAQSSDPGTTSDPGATSGDEGDTHQTFTPETTVTVEPPADNPPADNPPADNPPADDNQPSQTSDSNENIDPAGFYDMGGATTDTGRLEMKLAGGGVTDGVPPELQSEDEPPTFVEHQQDGGVIDTTQEGSEGMPGLGTFGGLPNNGAGPETRPELEPDGPEAPSNPGIDPYANKG